MGVAVGIAGLIIQVAQARQARQDAKKAQQQRLAFDARSAKLESVAILEEAELEAIEIRREGELIGKTQRALTAKAGIKLGRGTAAAIQEETRRLTKKDIATTREAAARKSEQLLSTFGAGTLEIVEKERLERVREELGRFQRIERGVDPDTGEPLLSASEIDIGQTTLEAEITRRLSEERANGNFIQSPKKRKTAFTEL